MTLVTWRNTALVLAAVCCFQRWQSCTRAAPASHAAEHRDIDGTTRVTMPPTAAPSLETPAATASGASFHGFKAPGWAMHLLPQHGETMRAYRDRILPLAQMAIAPQRARVARVRDDFALAPHEREELDAAVLEASTAIENRVMAAIANGELRPQTFKPMTGIALARDVLDIVDRGNTRFMSALAPDQRAKLASHRFDFADYLVFSAHWEDALHVLD